MTVTDEHPRPAGPQRDANRPGPARSKEMPTGPGVGLSWMIPQPWLRNAVCLGGLGAALWAGVTTLHPGVSGTGITVLVALVVAGAGWLGWVAASRGGPPLALTLAAMGAAGGVAATSGSAGLVFVGIAAGGEAIAFDVPVAAALAATAPAAFLTTAGVEGSLPGRLLVVGAVCLLGLLSATARRQLFQRGQQATLIATADQRAEVARRQAELAAERNRLGRELHDVLAHTLGALSIQLTALDALIRAGAGQQALREEIERSHRLVGEGLDEARQAVRALREDSAPLPGQIGRLCDQNGATFGITGTPRPVRAEASLALYRVAQEALTNAAKHAPRAPVAVHLTFEPQAVAVSVRNDTPDPAIRGRLAAAGGGYGLAGMRERVRLAGGQCQAGPADSGWQVCARVPA